MALGVSKLKALVFTIIIVLFFLILGEYICHWEEKLANTAKPSILEYQQLPPAFFEKQNLMGGARMWRALGITASYQTVALEKTKGTTRIGILGASAVAGMGYCPTWSFPGMLQRICDASGKNVQVINLGRVGYSSRQLVLIANAALKNLDLDYLIIYSGHNEFLEVNAKLTMNENLSGYTAKTKGLLSKSALYRTLHRSIFSVGKTTAKTDIMSQQSLPLPLGVAEIVRDEFEKNLSDIIELAGSRCRVALCTLPANLMFGPTAKEPFYLKAEGDEKWSHLFSALAYEKLGRKALAKSSLEKAASFALDNEKDIFALLMAGDENRIEFAENIVLKYSKMNPAKIDITAMFTLAVACSITGNWGVFIPFEGHYLKSKSGSYESTYIKGRIELLKGNISTARTVLSSARNLDNRRIRISSSFNDAIRKLANTKSVDLIELEADCWNYDHFNDYCHFNLDGNHLIATKIFIHLFAEPPLNVGRPKDWLAQKENDFLEPWLWMGVDENIWMVYTQRPQSLGVIVPDLSIDDYPHASQGIWATNRAFFTWAGGNPARFEEIENSYKSVGVGEEKAATNALVYLYLQEGLIEKAQQAGPVPSFFPFPKSE